MAISLVLIFVVIGHNTTCILEIGQCKMQTVTCIGNFLFKVEAWGLSEGEKGSRLQLCYWVVNDIPEKKGMDLWKPMLSSKCSFTCICRFCFALNPSMTTVSAFCSVCILPQPAFYSQSSVCILPLVCSLQSTVYVLHWLFLKYFKCWWFCQFHSKIHWICLKKEYKSLLAILNFLNLDPVVWRQLVSANLGLK